MDGSTSKAHDLWLAVSLFAIGCGGVWFSWDIQSTGLGNNGDPGPHVFPVAISVCLIVGAVCEFAGWLHLARDATAQPVDESADQPVDQPADQPGRGFRNIVFILATLVVALAITDTPHTGFPLMMFLFSTGAMMRLGIRWWQAAATGLLLVGVIYLLFVRLFGVQLPPGPFAW